MKTNVTVPAASMTLTHCSEKVNTVFQSVSESQIQFDSTHTEAVLECYGNIPIRQFINVLMMMMIMIIIIIK